jgi:hypothetical protein
MSTKLDEEPAALIVEESETQENSGAPLEGVVANPNGSLFLVLSAELLFIVFQYIGIDDKKGYIRLAIAGDDYVAHLIYNECSYLWRHIDLATFPGITDAQLRSLLERINAESVTQTFLLDKNPKHVITGSGLEPLRHSRVLESIDLRQCSDWTAGSTGLDDELVTDILSTVLPHELKSVKVRKQNDTGNVAFDQYCFPWSCFFANLCLFRARKCFKESCSHCDEPLSRQGNPTPKQVLEGGTIQCTLCKEYSCQPWNQLDVCPDIQQCRECLEWCCSTCRQVTECNFCSEHICDECEQEPLTCPWCVETSCASCGGVEQCKICRIINCVACGTNEVPGNCSRCHGTFCDECRYVDMCTCCGESFCEECCLVDFCDTCEATMCVECQRKGQCGQTLLKCDSCGYSACDQCAGVCDFDKCSYCGTGICHNESDCAEKHECRSPADLVYMARNTREGDDKANLCSCGKKHLSSPKGQTFICGWLQK